MHLTSPHSAYVIAAYALVGIALVGFACYRCKQHHHLRHHTPKTLLDRQEPAKGACA